MRSIAAMPRLEHHRLGRTKYEVSPLGLAGSFGIDADGTERAFHELGINYFFVTPRMKGLVAGLRRLIDAGHREKLVIAMGANVPTGGGVRRAFSKAAKVLGTDHIDVFHLFWVQSRWYVRGKTWPAMVKLRDEGKVGALAISCHDRPMARTLVDDLDLDVLMCRYNAAHRGAEREIFESLGDSRPGIVSYTATRWGRLLKPASGHGPMTAGECYRFAANHPKVDTVLCGAATFAELEADVRAVLEGPLPADRLEQVRAFGDIVRKTPTGGIGFVGG